MNGPPSRRSAAERVAACVRPEVLALSPYHIPDAGDLVKLDAMENPYPLPDEVAEALSRALAGAQLNRYPDGAGRVVKQALKARFAVPDGLDLMLGNGSDELLELIMLACGGPGRTLLTPVPTFSMYEILARLTGTRFVPVPLDPATLQLDLDATLAAIEREGPDLVVLARPNNPTGISYRREDVAAVIEATPGLVVIDEAYAPFADDALLASVPAWPQAICLRTLSKMGLAGIRLGFAAADPIVVDALERARLPYNVNVLTQVAAQTVLTHGAFLDAQVRAILASRSRLRDTLKALPGVRIWPSQTNFLLIETPHPGARVFEGLREQGVLVKSMAGAHPYLERAIRVTVGTDAENERFVAALRLTLEALDGS